ncbi:MAG: hypothetical protein MRZ78_01365 [Streptococcus sp.]|nr:hypothetical protein [Streptococcus sp.]
MALKLGLFGSPKKLTEAISSEVEVSEFIKVVGITTGILNQGEENERYWANLTGVDTELFERFESIGQEEHCPTFKVKLRNYHGEDLSNLQDVEISFNHYEVAFLFDKYKQPTGLALVLDLADISVK